MASSKTNPVPETRSAPRVPHARRPPEVWWIRAPEPPPAAPLATDGPDTTYLWRVNNLSDLTNVEAARNNLHISETGQDPTYLQKQANLSDVADPVQARINLGIPADIVDPADLLLKANNLSDVPDKAAARANLGITQTGADVTYLWRSNNLSDLANKATARTNLGVSATGADPNYLIKSSNLSDVPDKAAARTNLGVLGPAQDGAYNWRANNLSDVPDKAAARANLGITGTGGDASYLATANNLSDVPNKATARNNLGVMATGADTTYAYRANNLSDLASIPTARTNLGITATGADTNYAWRTNNLSDLTNAGIARTNLGLGTAAVANTGTSGHVVGFLDGLNTWSASQQFSSGWYLDNGFFADLNTGQPRLSFDNAGSSFLGFDRSNKTWRINVNGADLVHVDASGLRALGTFTVDDANFAMGLSSGIYPFIQFDPGDNILYDRGGNAMLFNIGGVTVGGFSVNGFTAPVGFSVGQSKYLQVGDQNFYLWNDGTYPSIQFDGNDYWQYDRTLNKLAFQIAGNTRFTIDSARVTARDGSGDNATIFMASGPVNGVRIGANTNWGSIDGVKFDNSAYAPLTIGGTSVALVSQTSGFQFYVNESGGFINCALKFVDGNCFISNTGSDCYIQFDANDYMRYDRAGNAWHFSINNYDKLYVTDGMVRVVNKYNDMNALQVAGSSFGLRLGTDGTYGRIDAMNADMASYAPLSINGNGVSSNAIGGTWAMQGHLINLVTNDTSYNAISFYPNGILQLGVSSDHTQVYGPNGNTDDAFAFRVSGASGIATMGVYGGSAYLRGVATDFSAPITISMEGAAVVLNARTNRLVFKQGDVERGMINVYGFTKLSNADGYWMDPYAGFFHELNSSYNTQFVMWVSSFASGDPIGIRVHYQNAAPNGPGNYFMYNEDSAQVRSALFGNGGLGNFPANNVNFASGAELKTDITLYSDAELDGLEAAFCAVDWGKWKYKDQTHGDWNHGYTAQGVAAAFALAAPELVDDMDLGAPSAKSDEPYKPFMRKGIYYHDLENISMALLSRALKNLDRAQDKIDELEARLAALERRLNQ